MVASGMSLGEFGQNFSPAAKNWSAPRNLGLAALSSPRLWPMAQSGIYSRCLLTAVTNKGVFQTLLEEWSSGAAIRAPDPPVSRTIWCLIALRYRTAQFVPTFSRISDFDIRVGRI